MKRASFVAFSILMLCSLLLLITVGTTKAGNPDYTRIEWPNTITKTLDGKWTTDDEWTDTSFTMINENVTFASTWVWEEDVMTRHIIEILNDNTNDTGDYWQIIADGDNDLNDTAPQEDDFRIELVGHTNLTVYQGNGTGWTQVTPEAGEITFVNSISASPTSSTPHWIAEFMDAKHTGVVQVSIVWGLRVAVYDESNSAAGVQAWPPDSERDVPNSYGVNNYSPDPIPEGLSFGAVVLLSSVAVIVATVSFRKRSKINNSN